MVISLCYNLASHDIRMQIMKNTIVFLLLSFSLFASVGEVIFIKGDVFVLRAGQLTPASVGMKLEEKDTVTTRKNSITRILFEDKSAVSVGSNSEFGIEGYMFDEKAANNNTADFKVQKGIFRMITGKIAKASPERFKLKTKTATMGIRGTTFSGEITDEMENIYCEKGAIYVTSMQVTYDIDRGYKTTIIPGKPPSKPTPYTALDIERVKKSTASWKDKDCD